MACRAALAVARAITKDNRTRAASRAKPVRIRVGLYSGAVVVENIGAPDRVNYTIVGDTVNICQRIETLGKALDPGDRDVVIQLGAATGRLVDGHFALTKCGLHPLVGRSGEIGILRLGQTRSPDGRPM